MMRAALLLAALLLAACQGKPLSPAAELAMRSHNQANQALARGDLDGAEAGFRSAMREAAALDDWHAEAESRIALAVSLQRQGRDEEAFRLLTPLLDTTPALPWPQQQRQRALIWQAQWHIAAAAWDALRDDLRRLPALCPASTCLVSSDASRLAAQLALHDGRLDDAARLAGDAVRGATADSERRSQALRVQANVALLHAPAEGIAVADAALAIDRALGNTPGIFQDLLLRTWLAHASGAGDSAYWLHRTCAAAQTMDPAARQKALQTLPEEIWHDYDQKIPPAIAGAAPAAGDRRQCRQP